MKKSFRKGPGRRTFPARVAALAAVSALSCFLAACATGGSGKTGKEGATQAPPASVPAEQLYYEAGLGESSSASEMAEIVIPPGEKEPKLLRLDGYSFRETSKGSFSGRAFVKPGKHELFFMIFDRDYVGHKLIKVDFPPGTTWVARGSIDFPSFSIEVVPEPREGAAPSGASAKDR